MISGVTGFELVFFSGSLSILVNGSPTEEVNIQRWLKQGDPLAPFLFLLVVEGFSGMIFYAESRNLYQTLRWVMTDSRLLTFSMLKTLFSWGRP